MKAYTQKFLRKRRMMTVMPLIVTPFLALLFMALGGGKGSAGQVADTSLQGMNTQIPDARIDSTMGDKLSLYQQALRDSQRLEEQRRIDPYSNRELSENGIGLAGDSTLAAYPSYHSDYPSRLPDLNLSDPNEQKVRSRLRQLEQQLAEEPTLPEQPDATSVDNAQAETQLRQMMESLQGAENAGSSDPEMAQISSMLDKIIDIQHPSRAREKLREQSQLSKGQVFSVSTGQQQITADLLAPATQSATDSTTLTPTHNSFYESSTTSGIESYQNKAIPAVVHESQTLEAGATIKLRLLEDVYINGLLIPKDNFVYGVCSLDGERLTVSVKYVRYQDNLFPVSLSVFDMDGIEGIRIPGAITRDATKQGLDQAIQSMELYSMDPSLGAQAAAAGVQTAKSLLSRKVKTIRATVRSGYPVLLLDQNRRNS